MRTHAFCPASHGIRLASELGDSLRAHIQLSCQSWDLFDFQGWWKLLHSLMEPGDDCIKTRSRSPLSMYPLERLQRREQFHLQQAIASVQCVVNVDGPPTLQQDSQYHPMRVQCVCEGVFAVY